MMLQPLPGVSPRPRLLSGPVSAGAGRGFGSRGASLRLEFQVLHHMISPRRPIYARTGSFPGARAPAGVPRPPLPSGGTVDGSVACPSSYQQPEGALNGRDLTVQNAPAATRLPAPPGHAQAHRDDRRRPPGCSARPAALTTSAGRAPRSAARVLRRLALPLPAARTTRSAQPCRPRRRCWNRPRRRRSPLSSPAAASRCAGGAARRAAAWPRIALSPTLQCAAASPLKHAHGGAAGTNSMPDMHHSTFSGSM